MSTTDNDNLKSPQPLYAGLIAEAEEAARYAKAIQTCAMLSLRARAGMSKNVLSDESKWYDDTRVMIAQGELDVLILAGSPREGVAIGELAAEHGVHVWRPPPLGRNFGEAIEVASRLKTSAVVYRVASWWEHVGPQLLHAIATEPGGDPLFSEIRLATPGPPLHSWRSSQIDAGGGVLLQDAYFMLEALLAIRGLPENVSGYTGKCRRLPEQPPRETEDVATLLLRYDDGGSAHICALWDLPPFSTETRHHGNSLSVHYDHRTVSIVEPDCRQRDQHPLPDEFLPAEMELLVREIQRKKQPGESRDTIDRHLAVSALLEAAYLAARTAHPEIPRRLFEVQKWPEPTR